MEDDHLVYVERRIFVLGEGGPYFYRQGVKDNPPFSRSTLCRFLMARDMLSSRVVTARMKKAEKESPSLYVNLRRFLGSQEKC